MSTLDDLRRWLEGENVPGLPDRTNIWPLNRLVPRAKRPSRRQYKVSDDGQDAILLFGKHKGKTVSQLAGEDKGYLRWLMDGGWPMELKEIAEYQLERRRDEWEGLL